jgi:hypothetical protein
VIAFAVGVSAAKVVVYRELGPVVVVVERK